MKKPFMNLANPTRGEKDDLFTLDDVLYLLGIYIKADPPGNVAQLGAYLTRLPLTYVRDCTCGDGEHMLERIVWGHALWDFTAAAIWQQVATQNRAAAAEGLINPETQKPEPDAVRDAIDSKRLDRLQPLLLAPLDDAVRDALVEALLSEDYRNARIDYAGRKLLSIFDDEQDATH